MRELSGLTYDEIGAALGVTNEAARRAVFDARSALHDAADGRATACVSIRHKLSDGDRRSLRARSVRAHLRSCDDCASFQRSISARQADLHVIGWLPGATGLGLLGSIGAAGGAGGARRRADRERRRQRLRRRRRRLGEPARGRQGPRRRRRRGDDRAPPP